MHVLARNLTLNIHHFLAQLFALFLAELRLVGRILRIRKRKRKGKNRQHYHPKAFRKSSFECFCFFSLKPFNSLRGSKFLAKHFANTRTLTRKELFLMLNIEQFEKIACQLRRDVIRNDNAGRFWASRRLAFSRRFYAINTKFLLFYNARNADSYPLSDKINLNANFLLKYHLCNKAVEKVKGENSECCLQSAEY